MKRPTPGQAVIASYSAHAERYDQARNLHSCWGRLSSALARQLPPPPPRGQVVEVGVGTGTTLLSLAQAHPETRFIGIEPAPLMRERARRSLDSCHNAEVIDGRFEGLPLANWSVDYLYSILAFHWTTDRDRSVSELRRVMRPGGGMDLYFPGRHTGREFTAITMPLLLRRFGLGWIREAARRRQHLDAASARATFAPHFADLNVAESTQECLDDLEGHWSWWLARAMAHLPDIAPGEREACDRELRDALQSLATPRGIPYTIHLLHVSARA